MKSSEREECDAFGPIAHERKYSKDYKLCYVNSSTVREDAPLHAIVQYFNDGSRNLPENLQILYNFFTQAAKLCLCFQVLQFKVQICSRSYTV